MLCHDTHTHTLTQTSLPSGALSGFPPRCRIFASSRLYPFSDMDQAFWLSCKQTHATRINKKRPQSDEGNRLKRHLTAVLVELFASTGSFSFDSRKLATSICLLFLVGMKRSPPILDGVTFLFFPVGTKVKPGRLICAGGGDD